MNGNGRSFLRGWVGWIVPLALAAALVAPAPEPAWAAKNVILMVSDGAGYNTWLATSFYRGKRGAEVYDQPGWLHLSATTYPLSVADKPGQTAGRLRWLAYSPSLAWDPFPSADGSFAAYAYLKRTATDSAAAGTALASGVKTYNNAINWIDPLGLTLDVDKKKNKEKIEDEDLFRNTPFAKDSAERKIGQHIVNAMIGDKERAYRFRSMNELRDFMAFKIYLVQAGYALAAKRNSFGNPITAAGSANWTNEAANDTKLAAEQKALVSNGSTMRLQGIKLAQNGGVSQGLKEIFGEVRSEGTFTFECATAQELVYAKATMDYFVKYRGQSEAWFDQQCKYADLFTRFGGWRARFQRGGTLREDVGNPALDPEKIIPGDFRRFQAPAQPNDNGNYNTLYLGGGNFYGHDGGVIATFTKKNPQGGVRTFMDDQRHELRTDEAFRWKLPPFREQANAPSGR